MSSSPPSSSAELSVVNEHETVQVPNNEQQLHKPTLAQQEQNEVSSFAPKSPELKPSNLVLNNNNNIRVSPLNSKVNTPSSPRSSGVSGHSATFSSVESLESREQLMSLNVVTHIGSNKGTADYNRKLRWLQNAAERCIKENWIEEFQHLINSDMAAKCGIDLSEITFATQNFCTLLHLAIKHEKLEIVNYIINDMLIIVDSTDKNQSTPLHYAIHQGSIAAVECLINHDAVVSCKDKFDITPLFMALKTENYQIATMLIDHQQDIIHIKGQFGNTAIHLACHEGNLKKVKFLLEKGASLTRTNTKGQTPFFLALPHVELLKFLIEQQGSNSSQIDPNTSSSNLSNSLNRQLLLKDEQGLTLVHACIDANLVESLKCLLSSVNAMSKQILNVMLNERESIHGNTPLIFAAKYSKENFITLLLTYKEVLVNAQNNTGNTALHMAIANSCQPIVEHLVNSNAKKNIKNGDGKTPAMLAKVYKMSLVPTKRNSVELHKGVCCFA